MLWIATVVGNIGTWIRDVASGWAMTDLSTSPLMVALVQAFGSLPVFLLALPAGALSDLLDRRKLLLGVQAWLFATSVTLAWLAATGRLDALPLLLLTLSGGVGAALLAPSWLAIVPQLVPRAQLRPAVALNSLGVNIARAIGPALGGVVLSAWGLAAAYGLDVLTYVVTALALVWWRPAAITNRLPAESLFGAMRAGVRYALASPELKRTLLRGMVFFIFATALWALLPLVARSQPGGTAGLYGFMLAAVGGGAIAGAVLMPRLRVRWSAEQVLALATLALAAALVIVAHSRVVALTIAACLLSGIGWIIALTTFGATVQAVLPDWVRGRGLSVHLTVFYGSMTLGSLLWGQVASATSLAFALTCAGAASLLSLLLSVVVRLPEGEANLTAVRPWPDPVMAEPPASARGPVCVMVEYRIEPARREEFFSLLRTFSGERRRNGAFRWQAYEDVTRPGIIVEMFLEASWAEHQRHHERVTSADADVQQQVLRFHLGPDPPLVRHLLA